MVRPRRVAPPRSVKAGRPPEETALSPRVRRRRRTARAELVKDGMILQTGRGPRALASAKKPKVKKR